MMAVRAWLETAIPPALGKEINSGNEGRYFQDGYRLFFLWPKGIAGSPMQGYQVSLRS